jgi:ADP-dependent NAD(P)H-hydrate dehydratase / NAD(P)H-hydrate epimerase
MQRAGWAAARLALAIAPHARNIVVASGPGNNGGDGLVAARCLHAWGKAVQVLLVGEAARLPADAAWAAQQAQEAGVPIVWAQAHGTESAGAVDLAIDALLGIGANRAPEGALAQLIAQLNRLDAPILAIDLPSGLNAQTGQPLGEQAVRATHSLALLTLKPGLFTAQGRDHAGRVWIDELGVATDTTPPMAILGGAARAAAAWPARAHSQHKGSFGDLVVIGAGSQCRVRRELRCTGKARCAADHHQVAE